MDTMTLIVSIAALVAVAVVLSRVLTWLFKLVVLAALVYFVFTRVDLNHVQREVEGWIHRGQKVVKPWAPDSLRRGSKGESVGL